MKKDRRSNSNFLKKIIIFTITPIIIFFHYNNFVYFLATKLENTKFSHYVQNNNFFPARESHIISANNLDEYDCYIDIAKSTNNSKVCEITSKNFTIDNFGGKKDFERHIQETKNICYEELKLYQNKTNTTKKNRRG